MPTIGRLFRTRHWWYVLLAALATGAIYQPPSTAFHFEATVTSPAAIRAAVYYDLGTDLSEANSGKQDLASGGGLVRLPLPFGTYRRLRFDPLEQDGTVVFRSPQIVDAGHHPIHRFQFSDFQPNDQIDRLVQLTDGSILVQTKPGVNDPALTVVFDPPLALTRSLWQQWRSAGLPALLCFVVSALGLVGAEWILLRSPPTARKAWTASTRLPSQLRIPFRSALVTGLLAAVFLALAVRQHQFVDAYAVNMMSWDQWDFYQPLFRGEGWWATFDQQHGPHRQGAGFVVTRILCQVSGWNSRWDAFAISTTLVIAAALGWWLARRCGAGLHLSLLAVPLLFFNVRQQIAMIGAANLSHGAMPVLLLMLLCLVWFIRLPIWRIGLSSLLTFLLLFTGFGLFAGLLTPALFLAEAGHALRRGEKPHAGLAVAGLVLVGLAWLAFGYNYAFQPAVGGFRFPYEKPWEYVEFAALMLTNFFGLPGYSQGMISVGLVLLAAIVAIGAWHGARCLSHSPEREPRSTVIFVLCAFVLLFCANTAVGRVFLGLPGAAVSRYVTLLIPAGFALYLHLATAEPRRLTSWVALLFMLALLPGTTRLRGEDWAFAKLERDGRLAWKAAYLETRDEKLADARARFQVYPGSVADRLRFLEQHRLNLFNPAGQP